MPGAIASASVPVVSGNPIVFPQSLCKSFTEARTVDARFLEYHDGTTERMALVATSRREWKLTKRLTPSALATLKAFWLAHTIDAFYFYNPNEPASGHLPGSNYDATGASLTGRYTVRFVSEWSEQIFIPRTEVDVQLIEVA